MKRNLAWAFGLFILVTATIVTAQSPINIHQATLVETDQKTKEVSTEELRKILLEKSATVFDARPFKEYAISHIPGAVNVAAKAGQPISLYISDVAEIGRVLKNNKTAPIVLYCNGPFCGKSKRLAAELVEAGYTDVRRYQLGIPVWRALGGMTQIEAEGIRYLIENDRTAVFIDARDAGEFKAGSIAGARNIPQGLLKPGKDVGEIKAAKDDGRLPMEDHNTRIIVFGKTAEQARAVAEAIMGEAFHNVSIFDGSFEQFKSVTRPEAGLIPRTINAGWMNSRATNFATPDYPASITENRRAARVDVRIMTEVDGSVASAEIIRGPAELHAVAMEAAKKLKFPPTRLEGLPAKVAGWVSYDFKP